MILGSHGRKTGNELSAANAGAHAMPHPEAPPRARRQPGVAPASRFSWSRLDSQDPRQFAANLRAVGCPEHVAKALVLDLILSIREEKFARIPPCPPWADPTQARAAKIRVYETRQTIRAESDALARELTGALLLEPLRSDDDLMFVHALMSVLIGPMTEEKLTSCAMAIKRSEGRKSELESLPPIACWREVERIKTAWPGLPAGILSPQEERMLSARAFAFFLVLDRHDAEPGFDWTAPELQRISEVVSAALPATTTTVEDSMDAMNPEELHGLIAGALPPARAQEWRRSIDRDYRDALSSLKGTKQPDELAVKVHSIKEAVENAWIAALTDSSLSEEERAQRVSQLRQGAGEAVSQALGPAFKEFASRRRAWMSSPEGDK